jgi:hypothetical protein
MRLSKKSLSLAVGTVIIVALALVYSVNLLAAIRRDLVYEELQRVAGKDVAFDEFEVTLLTGLGFSARNFRIGDSPIFAATPLLRAQELRMGVSLLSLMLGISDHHQRRRCDEYLFLARQAETARGTAQSTLLGFQEGA